MSQLTGDSLRNQNSFDYLQQFEIAIKAIKEDELYSLLDSSTQELLALLPKESTQYNPKSAYGDLYSKFLENLEEKLPEFIHDLKKEAHITKIYQLIDIIYNNNNSALPNTIKQIENLLTTKNQTQEHDSLESAVTEKLNKHENFITRTNRTTPQAQNTKWSRFSATFLNENFKPQLTTSMSSVRKYEYTRDSKIKELRFGTQAQRHKNKYRISPLFKLWIEQQARHAMLENSGQNDKITHVYFNKLGLDRNSGEGLKERNYSFALHDMEVHNPNIAVITLPADKGVMDESMLTKPGTVSNEQAKKIVHTIATRGENKTGENNLSQWIDGDKCDFKVSDKVKSILYKDNEEKAEINRLIEESLNKLGLLNKENLSYSELQAVMFHFINYEYMNYSLTQLTPEFFNASCKDAIDRGGVASAYYNLIKSIELETPMSKEEFIQALHAAPTLVKGRSMNHHINLIWNTLSLYVDNPDNKEKTPEWLEEWVFENCPSDKVEKFAGKAIDKGLKNLSNELNHYPEYSKQHQIINEAIASLEKTKDLMQGAKSGAYSLIYQSALIVESFALKTVDHLNSPEDAIKKAAFDAVKVRYTTLTNKTEAHYFSLYKVLSSLLKNIVNIFTAKDDLSIRKDNIAEEITALNQEIVDTSTPSPTNKR